VFPLAQGTQKKETPQIFTKLQQLVKKKASTEEEKTITRDHPCKATDVSTNLCNYKRKSPV